MSPTPQTRFREDQIAAGAFIAHNATVFGDVTIGDRCSVLFQAVIRGDCEQIKLGTGCNVQDHCVLHADPGYPCIIGDNVTLGHGAIVHGATVEDNVLVGMRAVIMNGASVGQGSVIAAGALITEGMQIPPRSIVAGLPGKIRGETTEKHQRMIDHAATHYQSMIDAYKRADLGS